MSGLNFSYGVGNGPYANSYHENIMFVERYIPVGRFDKDFEFIYRLDGFSKFIEINRLTQTNKMKVLATYQTCIRFAKKSDLI